MPSIKLRILYTKGACLCQPINWSMATILCDCHMPLLYAPTSNTSSHDKHEKINLWVTFSFLYGYGAPFGGPLGCRSSAIIGHIQVSLCLNFNKSSRKTFHMKMNWIYLKMNLYCRWNTFSYMYDFTQRLILTQRHKRTQKWPIVSKEESSSILLLFCDILLFVSNMICIELLSSLQVNQPL